MRVKVECYSGRKADERPLRFRLDGHEYSVQEVIDEWYGPHSVFFKVRAQDGNVYILQRRSFGLEDAWSLESFRSIGR
jgi:uncharacterized protein (UPF0128 family)